MTDKNKIIAIAGAGFAGLRAALTLVKKLPTNGYDIVLIDEHDTHIYTPDLYEIATAFNEKITQECLTNLKDTVAIPYRKILRNKPIRFVRNSITQIDPAGKKLMLKKGGAFVFDYLVVALGSVVNYYGIEGLKEHSYALKTITDALAINCYLDHFFQTKWQKGSEKIISIVVGGGGATGVEFTGELPNSIDKLCKKYECPRSQVRITLVEGSQQLTGQGKKVTSIILEHFKKHGIICKLGTRIKKVGENVVHISRGDGAINELPMDILIWAGGVIPNPLIRASFPHIVAKNDALLVNEYLQNEKFPFIYAAGDNAFFVDSLSSKTAPLLAQVAFDQGAVIGHNIAAELTGGTKKKYKLRIKGVIIPLGGKYAILKTGSNGKSSVLEGFFIWMLRRFVDLRYALSILPFRYAVKKWIHDMHIFVKND